MSNTRQIDPLSMKIVANELPNHSFDLDSGDHGFNSGSRMISAPGFDLLEVGTKVNEIISALNKLLQQQQYLDAGEEIEKDQTTRRKKDLATKLSLLAGAIERSSDRSEIAGMSPTLIAGILREASQEICGDGG